MHARHFVGQIVCRQNARFLYTGHQNFTIQVVKISQYIYSHVLCILVFTFPIRALLCAASHKGKAASGQPVLLDGGGVEANEVIDGSLVCFLVHSITVGHSALCRTARSNVVTQRRNRLLVHFLVRQRAKNQTTLQKP